MLNTIYEEFDFESKIKELKNKKIKIKRVVKKDGTSLGESQLLQSQNNKESIKPTGKPQMPGLQQQQNSAEKNLNSLSKMTSSQDIKKSVVLDNNNNTTSSQNLRKSQQIPQTQKPPQLDTNTQKPNRKINNALFYSTEINVPGGRLGKPGGDEPPSSDNQDYNQQQYHIQNPREQQKSNPMFMSQDIQITRNKQYFQTDLQHMMLPPSVSKILKEEDKNIQGVLQHIQKQKKKVDYEIDAQIREVLDAFNKTRKRLHQQFDEYLIKYKENYQYIKDEVENFKKKSKDVPSTLSAKTITDLVGVQIFNQEDGSEKLIKIKEEKCKLRTSLDNIQREVQKKLMGHFADEISKSTYHLPLFNHSSTSQMLSMEIKVNLLKAFNDNLNNYDHLVYKNPQPNFTKVSVQPQIAKVVSQDRYSVIGDFQSKALSLEIQKEFQTNHQDTIMCLYALKNNIVATGGNDGKVEIIDIDQEKTIKVIDPQYPVFSLGIFHSDKLSFESKKMEEYLVIGGAQVKMYGINDNYIIKKQLNISKQQKIICMQELRDSQTLALGGYDGAIYLHNIMFNKTQQVLTDHGATVNCLALTQDGTSMISGSSDRKILVYKLNFEKSEFKSCTLQRTIIDQSQIYSLNASLFKSNLVFSGGSDCKIKLWNIQSGQLEREIVGHRSPISQMILCENPFIDMKQGNYQMISSGTNDEALRISNGICSINNGVAMSKRIENNWAGYASPTMQLIRTKDNELGLVIASQEDRLLYTIQIN